jgi:hypothetical protein
MRVKLHPEPTVRRFLLGVGIIGAALIVAMLPPIPQPLAYHLFADRRSCLGIANCLNVLSNLPFSIVGLLGLAVTFSSKADRTGPFADPWERWPYAVLFAGVVLTTAGSIYYHLAPDNARLAWDRLPMSVAFTGLLTALLAERVSVSIGRWLLGPLLLLGPASVAYWYWSELQNAGDLRFYLLVQFGSLLTVVLLVAFYPARYRGTAYLIGGLAAYMAAIAFELADQEIFAFGQMVSGHTLKHLAAAGGVACLVAMLRVRIRAAAAEVPSDRRLQQTAMGGMQ